MHKMFIIKIISLSSLVFFSFVSEVPAVELVPFSVRNFSPPALVHGLAIAESASILSPGKKSLRFSFDIINNANLARNNGETIVLDGETYIATIGARYGLTENIQIGLDIPYVQHADGFLDSVIYDWHNFFGFPNGDRNVLPDNELRYFYSNNKETFNVNSGQGSLGDIRGNLIYEIHSSDIASSAAQISVKAPTGKVKKLTGSNGWDVSFALMTQLENEFSYGRYAFWTGLAANHLSEGKVLKELVNQWVASGWLGLGWSPKDWFGLKIQVDSHSELYDSKLKQLGDPALILTLGGVFSLTEKTRLELAFGEDLNVDASPDITFHLGLTHNF